MSRARAIPFSARATTGIGKTLAPMSKAERQLGVLLREPLPLDCSFEPGFAEESAIQDTVDESRLAITRRGAPRLGRNRGIRACTARVQGFARYRDAQNRRRDQTYSD